MQADRKGIVTFSDFLNLNEQNIFHAIERGLFTQTKSSGGYDGAERQMAAFIPDALSYAWSFPIACILAEPRHAKFAEPISHRDLLGAVMHLGIDRSKIGDIMRADNGFYIFCEEGMSSFLLENLSRARHTELKLSVVEPQEVSALAPALEETEERIASNRIDAIIAKAYHLSRAQAAEALAGERVFVDGRCVTDCNRACGSGAIISVRGHGRFRFETDGAISKKGKLCVSFWHYR